MAGWTDDLASLFLLRDSLEGTVSTDDITVLQERLQLLQCQWGEVCHQVDSNVTHGCHTEMMLMPLFLISPPLSAHQLSLRRQQVSEKLNEWAVFNEKNKELCEWLTQMESKVSQNGDISIEEMMEKLRKVSTQFLTGRKLPPIKILHATFGHFAWDHPVWWLSPRTTRRRSMSLRKTSSSCRRWGSVWRGPAKRAKLPRSSKNSTKSASAGNTFWTSSRPGKHAEMFQQINM